MVRPTAEWADRDFWRNLPPAERIRLLEEVGKLWNLHRRRELADGLGISAPALSNLLNHGTITPMDLRRMSQKLGLEAPGLAPPA